MSARAAVLEQRPYSGLAHLSPQIENRQILEALQEIVTTGGINNRDDARVAAFAWYHGVERETVLELFRAKGVVTVLQEELGAHEPLTENGVGIVRGLTLRRLGTFNLARDLKHPDWGWAIAILAVAETADFHAITECVDPAYDPSRLTSLYLGTLFFIPGSERGGILSKLLGLGDPISIEVAVALLLWWVEMGVKRGDMEINDAFSAVEENAKCGAVLLGAVIGTTARYRSPRVAADVIERADEVDRLINEAGKRVFADGKAVNAALKVPGIRYLDVLAAMSRWREDPDFSTAASKALKYTISSYLEEEFSSRQHLSSDEAGFKGRLTKWSIAPLAAMLRSDGFEVDIFENYFNGLATDSFSQMTRHMLFLGDRQRAIILLAVTGLVASARGDSALLEAVRRAADRLKRQPHGVVEVLEAAQHAEFLEKCGFGLPEK
jgi:hypothetical protein